MSKYPHVYDLIRKFTVAGTLSISLSLVSTGIQAGPAVNADVFLYDRAGALAATRTGAPFANFQPQLSSRVPFPVTMRAFRGNDLVTGMPLHFTHYAAALSATQQRANVNAYSTLVVEMARGMTNGLNATNIAAANAIVIREFNFGLQTTTVPDPMRTAINARNVANIVRGSEAVGEVIRRTRSALARAGFARSHDDIVRALAADLRNGRLDGRGAAPTHARIAATANVVSAQVLIEGLQNRLYVDGNLATGAMDNAIRSIMPSTTALTGSVPVPAAMLAQTRRMLSAVRAFDSRTQITALANVVNQIAANSSTATVRRRLTDNHSRLLDVSVTNIAHAPLTTVQAVNNAVRSGTAQPVTVTNRPPVISGTPRLAIATGTAYRFQPTASDPDGNTLRFSIANKPAWAVFNATTGALTGTPTSVGSFGNIIIRVNDGRITRSLPAFTITVTRATTANRAPTISGTPATSGNAGMVYYFRPAAADRDGDALSFTVSNKPAWASFYPKTGVLSGFPPATGTFSNIVIRVSDGRVSTALPAFSIRVGTSATTANRAPTISGTPVASVNVGSVYSFAPTAVDLDGDRMTFSITNRPAWATFNTTTGRLSGTPTAANAGTYGNIVIRVSDGRTSTALRAFSIRVNGTTASTGNVTLRWVAPSTRSNGTSLSLSQISGYRIRYGTAPGSYTRSAMNSDGDTAHTVRGLAPGTYYFVVNTVDTSGRESGYTRPVSARVR